MSKGWPFQLQQVQEALIEAKGCLRTDQYDGHRRVAKKIDAALRNISNYVSLLNCPDNMKRSVTLKERIQVFLNPSSRILP